jgi:hypothetical protein
MGGFADVWSGTLRAWVRATRAHTSVHGELSPTRNRSASLGQGSTISPAWRLSPCQRRDGSVTAPALRLFPWRGRAGGFCPFGNGIAGPALRRMRANPMQCPCRGGNHGIASPNALRKMRRSGRRQRGSAMRQSDVQDWGNRCRAKGYGHPRAQRWWPMCARLPCGKQRPGLTLTG